MKFNFQKSFTLVDALVGIFLLILIFVGIFGGYQLMLKTINQSRIRTIATYLCTKEIESIRNLSYDEIGTVNGYPSGNIPQTKTETSGGVPFQVETKIDFVADEADGLSSPDDPCPNDYKKVTVTVSWGEKATQKVSLSTNISPDNEVQECEEKGGILWANVFDAQGALVDGATVDVKDVNSGLEKQCTTSTSQRCYIILPSSGENPENYKITVTKSGYSTEQTYKTGDSYNSQTIADPQKPNATIFEGEITKMSFSIDKLSSLSIETRSPKGEETFQDDFSDNSKVSQLYQTTISSGKVQLSQSNGQYFDSGYVISVPITPSSLYAWENFSFSDQKDQQTSITYQILYLNGDSWDPIPDEDLSGNEEGFSEGPVDLSSLDVQKYSQIKLKANLSTSDSSQTPSLLEWQVSYDTKESHLIGNVSFEMKGEKIVGQDSNEQPIYKYKEDLTSDDGGHLNLSSVEWDNYHFSENDSTGMNLVDVYPSNPVSIAPDTSNTVILYFESQNSLLVRVNDSESGDPIVDASVRLYDDNYDKTLNTDSKGETYFAPLESKTYNLSVSAQGYESWSGQISVSGETTKTISLTLSPQ